jgi:hypothetical protein
MRLAAETAQQRGEQGTMEPVHHVILGFHDGRRSGIAAGEQRCALLVLQMGSWPSTRKTKDGVL